MNLNKNNHEPFSLKNNDLFKNFLDVPLSTILDKYSSLVNEYFKFIFENIPIKNVFYTRFIIFRGLETITNVFNNILYYTKNIDLAYFHSQRSFYFYIEFIGQISNIQNSFLQLTSRDAVIYVYKKTILEISHEYQKKVTSPTVEENDKYKIFDKYVKIYKSISSKMINDDVFLLDENKNRYLSELDHMNQKINLQNLNQEELDHILLFIQKLVNCNGMNDIMISIENFFQILLLLLKKIKKKPILKEKLNAEHFEIYLKESSSKLIEWITNPL